MTEALAAGSRVGSYEIIDRLGMGGMGAVYRARDTRLGRTVALKVLRPGADPELLHRLDREARAASALSHPNIVQIYDVGVAAGQDGEHFVVMEYAEGETLRRRLARGPLPIAEVVDVGAQLADGLARAHRAGIIHRDLKPENIVVTPDGTAKILDFGLAKVLPAPLADLEGKETLTRQGTQAGMLLGTLEYMSPEQASGRPVDHRTDQFALGLILAEMATGRPLFHRETPAQVLAAIIEREAAPLRQLRADAPPALEALVARCLSKNPDLRFDRTDDLALELGALGGRSRAGSLAREALAQAAPAAPGSRVPALPAVSAEILPATPRPAASATYHVQTDATKNTVKRCDELELADLIRSGKLTGVELVRLDAEDEWKPLYESRLFRREVPNAGDPRDAAGRRVLKALGGHFTAYAITTVVMLSQGEFPFWLAIWGGVLTLQIAGTLPGAWSLLARRIGSVGGSRPALAVEPQRQLPPPAGAATPPSAIALEATRVRGLIEQRGGQDAKRLLTEVDGIVALTAQLTVQEADLAEQTSDAERARLGASMAEARSALEHASQEQDRRLFERQLEVLRRREEAIAKAMRVLKRLRVRRELAEHQLKQLRLDLSRGAAIGLDVPELSSRLQYIRHEVDAKEEVAEIDAATD